MPVEQIAAGMGMKRSTVFAWKKAWKAGGVQALTAKPVPGRPGTLSDEQSAELKVLLTDHTPVPRQNGRMAIDLPVCVMG